MCHYMVHYLLGCANVINVFLKGLKINVMDF
jgi:hypothetical protein